MMEGAVNGRASTGETEGEQLSAAKRAKLILPEPDEVEDQEEDDGPSSWAELLSDKGE